MMNQQIGASQSRSISWGKCGVYCQSIGRVILYTKDEIETHLKDAPSQVLLGRGTEACPEVARRVEDPRVPLNIGALIGLGA